MKLEIDNPTKEQIIALYNAGIPFSGFRGGFLVEESVFDEELPSSFTNRLNEDDSVKTYRQYTRCVSLGGYSFIYMGERSDNGNRKNAVSAEEFELWVTALGINNLVTEDEAIALRNSLLESEHTDL